ncbi:hypothetical protein LUZ62_055709 [Rhynchospora pubera]|uniref:Senescence regulator S40 n=1 Tax=Rhynchospora pubera TaxID=906938 RepID=A0AAV8DYX7_9POAL|nr:hypothetical protein LUZ62_055709 [Rhynchospora pubera]
MEELLESEVMWPENMCADSSGSDTNFDGAYQNTRGSHCQANNSAPSSPIAIQSSPSSLGNYLYGEDKDNGWDDDEFGELVPPHVLVDRRRNNGEMAFSLCSGQGRTLKGRELRQLRNTVWRLTGFMDG